MPGFAGAQTPEHRLQAVEVADQADAPVTPTTTDGLLGLSQRETPATVNTVDRDDIEQLGLRNLIELYRSAPGVAAGNIPGSPASVSMRGLTDVGYLFDGVRVADPSMVSRNLDTWNLEKVEILKGPASVLHGSGALGGTINLVTRKPSLAGDRVDGMIEYGSHDSLRLGVGANRVVNPNVAVRADLSHGRSNGYVDDTDSETTALTTGILVQATDRLTLSAAVDLYSDRYATPYQGTPLVPASVARDPSDVVSGGGLVLDESMRDNNYNVRDGEMTADSQWLRTKADYQLSDRWRLINELSLYNANRDWANSEDFSYNDATGQLDRGTTRINHHHRFATDRFYGVYDGRLGERRHRLAVGAEYQYTDFDSRRRFGATSSVDPFDPDRGYLPPNTDANYGSRADYDSQVSGGALFLEDALNLTPNWVIVSGLRYEYLDLDRGIDDLAAGTRETFGQTYEDLSWRLGTVHDLNNQVQVFAQYNRAAVPVSGLLLSRASNVEFDLSKGRAVEVGSRAALLDDRATLTVSLYRLDQDDILTRDPANPALSVQGGRLRAEGVEVDLTLRPHERWWVNLNGAYNDAEYDELLGAGGVDLSGNRLTNVPEKTANLSSAYTLAALPLTLGGAVRYSGDFYTSTANEYRIDERTLVDAWISYPLADGTLTLRGRNLTDEFYADWSGYSATQVYIGEPRTVEIGWTGRF
ncbi:TonB-dependent siderophore receptor [Alcanivorax marinus]|nr:TonB-dependent siderophore receptor [Alloalcanivorax marinus]MBL7251250.1 TonB-dependent siderophore receptor [Alloalcanivorax marinus]